MTCVTMFDIHSEAEKVPIVRAGSPDKGGFCVSNYVSNVVTYHTPMKGEVALSPEVNCPVASRTETPQSHRRQVLRIKDICAETRHAGATDPRFPYDARSRVQEHQTTTYNYNYDQLHDPR